MWYVESPKALSSVLYSLLCTRNTSPLSTLISSLLLNHHLYADDTQLFLSFRPPDFDSSVTHLRNALQHISSWMTANLLTLNSSKTEFLLIGLQQQLTKIHNCSARKLGSLVSSLTVISLSPTKYHLSLSLVIITFVNFVVSAPILTPKLPVPLPHLLFILSLITATLCITTFQNLKHFRLFRTLLPGLWLRPPNSVMSPLFSNLYIGLKSTNALNINFFLLPIKLPSCYSLLIILLSPFLDHIHLPP